MTIHSLVRTPLLTGIVLLVSFFIVSAITHAQAPIFEPDPEAEDQEAAPTAIPSTGPLDPSSPAPVAATIINPQNAEGQMRNRARMTNLAANLSTRMENTHRRLADIQRRLEARRVIIAGTGADTTATINALAQASSSLAKVATRLATIDADVAMGVGAMDVSRAWGTLRTTYSTMQTDLLAAHTALTTALTALKTASPSSSATTTESR